LILRNVSHSGIHAVNTRHKYDFHKSVANLTVNQTRIKLYNMLPCKIKYLSTNSKQFKAASKELFTLTHYILWGYEVTGIISLHA
jgi:hypothetical protein